MKRVEITEELLLELPPEAIIQIAVTQEKIIKTQEELINDLKFVKILQENTIDSLRNILIKGGRI